MRKIGRDKKMAFYQAHVGQIEEVLVEGPAPDRPGWLRGVSANYLKVVLPGQVEWQNRRLGVRFLQVWDEMLVGEVITSETK